MNPRPPGNAVAGQYTVRVSHFGNFSHLGEAKPPVVGVVLGQGWTVVEHGDEGPSSSIPLLPSRSELKRAYVREAPHAVIVKPVGHGGRSPFNPDLLVLVAGPVLQP